MYCCHTSFQHIFIELPSNLSTGYPVISFYGQIFPSQNIPQFWYIVAQKISARSERQNVRSFHL